MCLLAHKLRWAGITPAQCDIYVPIVCEYVGAGQPEHAAILMARALYHRDAGFSRRLDSDADAIEMSIESGM